MRTRSLWPDRRQPIAPIADDAEIVEVFARPATSRDRDAAAKGDNVEAGYGPPVPMPGERCPRCHRKAPRSDGAPCALCAPPGTIAPIAFDPASLDRPTILRRLIAADVRDHHLATIRASMLALGLHEEQVERVADEIEAMVEECAGG